MITSSSTGRANHFHLWFALLGGAAAWGVHLIGASVIAEWGHFAGLEQEWWLGLTVIAWLIIALSLAMITGAAAATIAAGRLWSSLKHVEDAEQQNTARFMARAGLATSSVFLLIILAQTIPILFFMTNR